MTPADLAAAGEALFGDRWKAPLARALDVQERTLERWADGSNRMWPDTAARIRGQLVGLLRERGAACLALAERMGAAAESSAPRDDGGQQHRA